MMDDEKGTPCLICSQHLPLTPWSFNHPECNDRATEREKYQVCSVPFQCSLSVKSLFYLRSTRRSEANQKCRHLHRPWSASPLFGLKQSRGHWSYFKLLDGACPVLPIAHAGSSQSLINCLAALVHPSGSTQNMYLPALLHIPAWK